MGETRDYHARLITSGARLRLPSGRFLTRRTSRIARLYGQPGQDKHGPVLINKVQKPRLRFLRIVKFGAQDDVYPSGRGQTAVPFSSHKFDLLPLATDGYCGLTTYAVWGL